VGAEFYLMGEKTITFLNLLRKLILCAIFISLLIRLDGKFNAKLLTVLAETSFGIFFIHSYFISAFTQLELKILHGRLSGNIALLLIFIVFILLLSTGIVLLVRKGLGKHSRFLLGS
jgi:peptidoglycan/LPS O-acetylase OafA/YrhL